MNARRQTRRVFTAKTRTETMARKLPLCAFCGQKFKRNDARVIEMHDHAHGQPHFGWHMNGPKGESCYSKDPLTKGRDPTTDEGWAHLMRQIDDRGPGRVVLRIARKR
jgi:hypothetical protein